MGIIKPTLTLAANASTATDFLKSIMDGITESSSGIIKLGAQSNSYGQHTLGLIDKNVMQDKISWYSIWPISYIDMLQFCQIWRSCT